MAGGATLRDVMLLCGRALRRRCPNCGAGGVWRGWFRLRDACPACGLPLDRGESDHFYGAYLFNFVAAELLAAGAFIVWMIAAWPDPPWTAITWGAVAAAIAAPIVTYPFTKALWLAIDLAARPHRPGEEA